MAMNRIRNYVEKERRKTIQEENSTYYSKMMNGIHEKRKSLPSSEARSKFIPMTSSLKTSKSSTNNSGYRKVTKRYSVPEQTSPLETLNGNTSSPNTSVIVMRPR